MEDTGRIREPLDWRARRIVFGDDADREIREELPFYVRIDRAHLVMLMEVGILPRGTGRRLLAATDQLVAADYAPLRGRPAPRGLYLLYEHWLIETLGEATGGAVHLGRSRNDMSATVLRLRLRGVYHRFVREVLRLLAVLVRRAERYARTTMPVYTHYQAALPVTYGHYLAGVAVALLRDLHGIEAVAADLARCPLGAGAAGGTTVPIDTGRTARLLGFSDGVLHSIDSVASRDMVLRLLAAGTVLGATLSRLATDLQLWSTAEFDLVRFPDRLVGSSSMMPQKRNVFLLEHVKGRAGAPLGALTAAAMAMHATPFSNSVAVGTEGVKPLWGALEQLTEAVVLTRLLVAGARPQPENMRRRAREGFTAATELANRLVLDGGLAFRRAHHLVGEVVTAANRRGEPLDASVDALLREHGLAADTAGLDPAAVAAAAAYGGGPAEPSLRRTASELRREWTGAARRLDGLSRGWQEGDRALELAVAGALAEDLPPLPARREVRAADREATAAGGAVGGRADTDQP
ncbi:MAG TPA: argininosuccinate lyase [Longimicrobiaceae bacterium]|nr:argininosuccinate lyase [Longimicrobiaceae bacterium]